LILPIALKAQFGGYNPAGSQSYLGANSNQAAYDDSTINDGSIRSAANAIVYIIGRKPNQSHYLLQLAGGALFTQAGSLILENGTGGLFINDPSTGLEILNNFNFNGQKGQVSIPRNSAALLANNLHIDAGATISGADNLDNVDGYLKKDGDGNSFLFPLAQGLQYSPLSSGPIEAGNSIIAAYYFSSPATAANFEEGPFPITQVAIAGITISSQEYWNATTLGNPSATITLQFSGNYSVASVASLFIFGWSIADGQWEQIPNSPATGLSPGNSISSMGQLAISNYAAFTLGYIVPPIVTAISGPSGCGHDNGYIVASGSNGIPPYQFSLNGSAYQLSDSFPGLGPGPNTIYIKDSYGLIDSNTIIVQNKAAGTLFPGNDTIAAINEPIQLIAVDVDSTGYNQFNWSPPTGLNNPDIQDPIATLDQDITYTVTALAPDSCVGIARITIKVYAGPDIYVPTGFTPNGDGINDVLKPVPVGLSSFGYFRVYDRWGRLVYYTRVAGQGWDGTTGGEKQPVATYVWVAEGTGINGKNILRKGTVVLIR
jgi:gliding motility-associated-like protein